MSNVLKIDRSLDRLGIFSDGQFAMQRYLDLFNIIQAHDDPNVAVSPPELVRALITTAALLSTCVLDPKTDEANKQLFSKALEEFRARPDYQLYHTEH